MTAVTCKAHCAQCGLHFSSTEAFDMHRVGDHQTGTRRCEHPIDAPPRKDGTPKFTQLTTDGQCRVYEHRDGYGIAKNVTIWTRGDIAARRAALNTLSRIGADALRPSEGLGVPQGPPTPQKGSQRP